MAEVVPDHISCEGLLNVRQVTRVAGNDSCTNQETHVHMYVMVLFMQPQNGIYVLYTVHEQSHTI